MPLKLEDIIDVKQFQMLQDRLNEIYSFPSSIIDNEGNVLTATAWQDICTKFHRQNKECEKECIKSDQYIADHLHEANPAVSYQCPHGLIDNATPIIIEGVHYGNFFTGQFFLKPPDLDFFRAQARRYGFDEGGYIEAVKKVPIWTQEQLNSYLFFIKGLIEVISAIGLKSLKEIETRKRMQTDEERVRTILQTAMDGFWLADMKGNLLEANETYARMSGYSVQELLVMRIPELEALETAIDTSAHIEKVLTQGEDRFESRHRRKDGTFFDVEVSVQYRSIESGRLVAFLRDITERKRVEEALSKSEAKFFTLFQSSPIITALSTKKDGSFIDVNQAFLDTLGYQREEVIGRTSTSLGILQTEDRQRLITAIPEKSDFKNMETVIRSKNGVLIPGLFSAEYIKLGNEDVLLTTFVDISERKQMEKTLKESEERFKLSMEATKDGLWDWHIKTDEGYFSPGYYRMLGYAPDEFPAQGGAWKARIHPDDLENTLRANMDCIAGRTDSFEVEYRMKAKNGGWRWILGRGKCVKQDEKGHALRLVGTHVDITERKRVEEDLRESEERHRILLSESPDPTFSFTPEGRYRYANKAFADGVGKPVDEIIGKSIWDVFSKDEADKRFASLSEVFRNGEKKIIEVRVPRTDGDRYYMTSITPIKDIKGEILFAICSSKDITERKHSEEAIKKSEEKFFKAFKASPEAITIASMADGRYIEVNDVFLKTTGFQKDEVIGRTSVELNFWFDSIDRKQYIEELAGKGFLKNFPIRYRMRDGEVRDFLVSSEIIDLEGKQCSLNFINDITESKRAEEEKEKLQDQLLQSQKMESVGRLAGGVAHDFNNMLGIIFGHVEMAMEQADPALPLYDDLRQIRKAAERSSDLTRQLLAFARKQTVSPKVIDMNKTVEGMLKMLRRLVSEDIHLTWLPGENLWHVRIDPSQIDQILANLCVNARDAIAGVGNVTIETANINVNEAYCVDHTGFIPGEYVLLTFSDDGCGMDKEALSHLFEPFFTTKETGKGTGLGLATVYGIVKQNNGFIDVDSEPDKGATFRIYLPRHIGKTQQAAVEGEQEPVRRGKETLLVVEDEKVLLDLSQRMLEKLGYHVLTASTPGEAIHLAQERTGAIHLLMTDVIMPEMNGRDLAKRLLSIYPNMKRLFMSGYTADVIAHHGVLDDGVHFIQKPFSGKDLSTKVREALDQK